MIESLCVVCDRRCSASPTAVAQVLPMSSASAPAASVSVQDHLVCFVNGKKHVLRSGDIQPEMTLLQFLRASTTHAQRRWAAALCAPRQI